MSPQVGDLMLAKDLHITEDAFDETADSKFCYLDQLRRHVFGRLLSGLYQGDGLFLLTGRGGIGKTMLLRHVSEQLHALDGLLLLCPDQVFACRAGITIADVFGACEARLGLGQSAAVPLKATKRLQQLVESDRSPVLLLDDVDLVGDDVLETLVTLSGLQAADRHLLSVVLAGHPDVAARVIAIAGNDPGPAGDRVADLRPMAEQDVAKLIRHRLRAARRAEETFDADAIARIARHCGGVPLAIVHTCRRALRIAESRSRKAVTAEIVDEAIGEKGEDDSTIPVVRPVASPAIPLSPSEASRPRPAPGLAEPRVAFVAPVAPKPAFSPAELRPAPVASTQRPPEPSLRREQHASIPEVTLGHHGPPPRPGAHDSLPAVTREEAWWSSDSTRTTLFEPMSDEYPVRRRRRRRSGVTYVLAGSALFVVLFAAALAIFLGGQWDFGGSARNLSAAGPTQGLDSPAAYDVGNPHAWWRPGGSSEVVAPRTTSDSDVGKTATTEQKPLPGLSSLDLGRHDHALASPSEKSAGDGGLSPGTDAAPPPVSSAAPGNPEPVSRGETTAPPTAKAEPPPVSPLPVQEEAQGKSPAPAEKDATEPKLATPKPAAPAEKPVTEPKLAAPKPAAPAAKLSTPETKPSAAAAKAAAPRPRELRSREIETLLAEGDARLEEGDLAAARYAYEQAYDKGSTTAAARMAQTFDPRNLAASRKSASPAEAILWYQDAARKGDRRAKAELDGLASWLENSAASGNQEARRVLELWREPAAPAAEGSAQ